MSLNADTELEALLQFLHQNRGFDFTGYKRPSLMRRVSRRLQMLGLESFADYVNYLQVRPEEFAQLFNTILINVTTFFRDPPAWDYVRQEVVPAILAAKGAHYPVRIWSAGCASGEEAYSIAMLFAEAMGAAHFRSRIKIYATDVDEQALAQGRQASYSAKEIEDLDPALRERYFALINDRWLFRADLRRVVIFGRHDLVQDAPISRLDLIVCRNALMYFNAETQARVLQRFHLALNGEGTGQGYLFLGRAEMMLAHANLFTPLELKHRVFAKVAQPGAHNRANMSNRIKRLREQAIEDLPIARMVVDANGALVLANQRARTLFTVTAKDIGRALHELEVSYRPLELRSLIEQAYAERRSILQTSVERRFADGEVQFFDITVSPYFDDSANALGVGFVEVSRSCRLQDELRRSQEKLETTNEELQSSNEELETTIPSCASALRR